jgi:hypothetical protein
MKFLTLINGKEEMRDIPTPGAINVSPGDFKYHFTHYTGAKTITEMQQLGWCVLDGTLAVSQLVTPGYFTISELAITGLLDNLLAQDFSGRVKSLFVRSGNSGTITEDTFQGFKIRFDQVGNPATQIGITNYSPIGDGLVIAYSIPQNDGMNGTPRTGIETKPASIEAVPMMYCLL